MNGALLLAYSGWMFAVMRPKLEPLWLWNGAAAYRPDIGGRIADQTTVRTSKLTSEVL